MNDCPYPYWHVPRGLAHHITSERLEYSIIDKSNPSASIAPDSEIKARISHYREQLTDMSAAASKRQAAREVIDILTEVSLLLVKPLDSLHSSTGKAD